MNKYIFLQPTKRIKNPYNVESPYVRNKLYDMPKELVVLGIASLNYMVSFSYVNIAKSVHFAFFYDKADQLKQLYQDAKRQKK